MGEETLTTYKRADGKEIWGEYSWVTELDFWDDEASEADYVEVIEERWVLAERRTIKLGNLNRWCAECDEDVTLTAPVDGPVYCPEHEPARPVVQEPEPEAPQ